MKTSCIDSFILILKGLLFKKKKKKKQLSASWGVDALVIRLFLHFDNKQKLLQRWFSFVHSVPQRDFAFKLTRLNLSAADTREY